MCVMMLEQRSGLPTEIKNDFARPPSYGLRTCTIRDEDLIVPWDGDQGSGHSLLFMNL